MVRGAGSHSCSACCTRVKWARCLEGERTPRKPVAWCGGSLCDLTGLCCSGKGVMKSTSSHGRQLVFTGEWREQMPYEGHGEIAVGDTTFKGDWHKVALVN
jgi:hypothetical protein